MVCDNHVFGAGQVHGQEMVFESPSAFSIFLKRLVNPSRKADDGWKTVKYNGRFLEQFKLELARRRFGDREEEGASDAIATRQIARPRVPTLKSLESGMILQAWQPRLLCHWLMAT